MRTKTLALAAVFSLAITGALGQVIIGGGSSGGGGTGNVAGPASSTDGAVALYDGTTGKLLKDGLAPSMTIGGASTPLGGTVTATTVLDSLGSTRGSMLYRGASGWTVLTPGTSGFFLKSNGAGADPAYASAAGSGTVTSVATGNGLCGGPITTTGTISTCVLQNAQTGTTYATLSTDGGKIVSLANASPIAVSLVQANTANFTAGFATDYNNIGAGLVTVTAATSVFDNGLTTLTVAKGQDAFVWSDGTNYHSLMTLPTIATNTVMGNVSGATNYPVSITATQLTALINQVTTSLPGTVAATGTPSGKFLRDDNTWATPAGGNTNSNWVAGNWYNSVTASAAGGTAGSSTITQYIPVFFDKPVTIGSVGVRVATASAGGTIKIAVYAASGSTGLPTGAPLCSTATGISTTTGNTSVSDTCSAALASAGRYWFAFQVDNATATVLGFSSGTWLNSVVGAGSQANLSGSTTAATTEYRSTSTFGTFATNPTVSAVGTTTSLPLVQFSLASVP